MRAQLLGVARPGSRGRRRSARWSLLAAVLATLVMSGCGQAGVPGAPWSSTSGPSTPVPTTTSVDPTPPPVPCGRDSAAQSSPGQARLACVKVPTPFDASTVASAVKAVGGSCPAPEATSSARGKPQVRCGEIVVTSGTDWTGGGASPELQEAFDGGLEGPRAMVGAGGWSAYGRYPADAEVLARLRIDNTGPLGMAVVRGTATDPAGSDLRTPSINPPGPSDHGVARVWASWCGGCGLGLPGNKLQGGSVGAYDVAGGVELIQVAQTLVVYKPGGLDTATRTRLATSFAALYGGTVPDMVAGKDWAVFAQPPAELATAAKAWGYPAPTSAY